MTYTNPDIPTPTPSSLVWTATENGPARQIIDEWNRMAHRPAVLRRVNQWEFLPRPVDTLDDLLVLCGFGLGNEDELGDDILWHLVVRAEHDELAARIVLHRILPALMAIARRRGVTMKGGIPSAISDVLAMGWIVIREFPHERRRHKIAANLVLDVEYYGFVRGSRLVRVAESQVGDDMLSKLIEVPTPPHVELELDDVLVVANELGVNTKHIELLHQLGHGMSGDEAADARGISPRTIRNHRRKAIDAVQGAIQRSNGRLSAV